MKMLAKLTEKPWGQSHVPHVPQGQGGDIKIGEVSFEDAGGRPNPVLIKYLYTSERLSIQVHPNNEQAQAFGYANGKDEMWIVLDAEPHSTIGLGLKREASAEELREAVVDGSIVDLVDWRSVARGDVIYNSAGTIHAAGADLILLEVQQAIDLTYRLYDYGRPRELHLDEGLAVAVGKPHFHPRDCSVADGSSRLLVNGPHFGAAWCAGGMPAGIPEWAGNYQVVVVEGALQANGIVLCPGEGMVISSLSQISICDGTVALIAWPVPQALAMAA
jgi:mannose-6-phosphate isomerase